MKIISENPYRTIGVYSGSSTRDIQKQLAKVKAFSRVGKQTKLETDFKFLGEMNRDVELIETAANKIEQAKNKVLYSLFWFYKSNHIDETALNYLAKDETEKAIELWSKLVDASNEKVTLKNFSSYLNLSTLFIELGYQNNEPELFLAGINFKGKAISSDVFSDFVQTIAGENILLNKEVISNEILLEILNVVDGGEVKLDYSELFDAFSSFSEAVLSELRKKYTEQPIQKIEREIEFAKKKRIKNPIKAAKYGEELYFHAISDLKNLKKILDDNNVELRGLINKLAEEILECSIAFYNSNLEDELETNLIDKALKLAEYAKKLNVSGRVENRINESIKTLNTNRFQDCYRAIDVLKAIKDVFIKLHQENKGKAFWEQKSVNKTKVLEVLNQEIKNDVIEKIGKSKNNEIINEFYDLIAYIGVHLGDDRVIEKMELKLYSTLSSDSIIAIRINEERTQREKRRQKKQQAIQEAERIANENKKKESDRKTKNTLIWFVVIALIIIGSLLIWGTDSLPVLGIISFYILLGWIRNS